MTSCSLNGKDNDVRLSSTLSGARWDQYKKPSAGYNEKQKIDFLVACLSRVEKKNCRNSFWTNGEETLS